MATVAVAMATVGAAAGGAVIQSRLASDGEVVIASVVAAMWPLSLSVELKGLEVTEVQWPQWIGARSDLRAPGRIRRLMDIF